MLFHPVVVFHLHNPKAIPRSIYTFILSLLHRLTTQQAGLRRRSVRSEHTWIYSETASARSSRRWKPRYQCLLWFFVLWFTTAGKLVGFSKINIFCWHFPVDFSNKQGRKSRFFLFSARRRHDVSRGVKGRHSKWCKPCPTTCTLTLSRNSRHGELDRESESSHLTLAPFQIVFPNACCCSDHSAVQGGIELREHGTSATADDRVLWVNKGFCRF